MKSSRLEYLFGWLLPTCLCLVCLSCNRGERRQLTAQPDAAANRDVRLAVVDDPAMAGAIRRLRNEWHAVAGGTLEVSEISANELHADGSKIAADALIFPATELGALAEAERLVPLTKEQLGSSELAWSEVLLLVQQGSSSWGEDVLAVPFGTPVLTLLYRRDMLEKIDREPPTTWEEYRALVRLLRDREKLDDLAPPADAPWRGTLEPLAQGWAGVTLLARAAAYAKHRDNFSTLFAVDDFAPLIDGPPFVKALEELVAANKKGGAGELPRLDASGVRAAFLAGQSALALTWPSAAEAAKSPHVGAIGFAELPGSDQSYNYATKSWNTRKSDDAARVPLCPVSGRAGGVLRSAGNPEAAFQLLAWLSSNQWATSVAAASPHTTLFRRSQTDHATDWVEPGVEPAAAKQYATQLQAALGRHVWIDCLRIPGREEYLAALDTAVEQTLTGEAPANQALAAAAGKWREISARLGIERQRAAYRKSLRLD